MEQQKPEPQLTDIGTRYEHLQDHYEALEACIDILRTRARYQADWQKLEKLKIAAEVLRETIDSYAGLKDYVNEFNLYRTVNSIPENPAEIPGGRGTPLV